MNNLLKTLRRQTRWVSVLMLLPWSAYAVDANPQARAKATAIEVDTVEARDKVERPIPINSEYPLPKTPLEMKGELNRTWSGAAQDNQVSNEPLVADKAVAAKVTTVPDEVLTIRFPTLVAKNIDVRIILEEIEKRKATKNVTRIHVVGHTDNDKIRGNARKVFADNYLLSQARSKLVADALAESKLGIPFSYEGRGPDQPVAPNTTADGKAKNRRTEIFLYYGPVEKHAEVKEEAPPGPTLLSRVQCMPGRRPTAVAPAPAPKKREAVRQVVTDPPDKVLTVNFKVLFSDLNKSDTDKLADFLNMVAKEKAIRQIHVRGHTDSDKIRGRAQKKFKNNSELSDYRAKVVADALANRFPEYYLTFEGKGEKEPIASNRKESGKAKNRRTDVWVYYGERVVASEAQAENDCPEGNCGQVAVAKEEDRGPFRVTVDGAPLQDKEWNDPNPTNHTDFQRCTDVALEGADVQVHFDALNQRKLLNVTPYPDVVAPKRPVSFRVYSNYIDFVTKAEIRLFLQDQSTRSMPLDVVPLRKVENGFADAVWVPKNVGELKYQAVLRMYGDEGQFDETVPTAVEVRNEIGSEPSLEINRNSGYGENRISLNNIPVNGGAVTVNGKNIPPSHRVYAMGARIPVDAEGRFVTQQILRAGKNYGIVVKVLNDKGEGLEFERDLHIPENDWFFVGIADLLIGGHQSQGPAQLVSTGLNYYDKDVFVDGRLAFYLKGKIQGKYLMTASADTREGPLKDIFSNFLDKDPQAVFRRLDPDKFYPVYGDDSTFVEDAPTQGKFYVKIERDSSYVMWGNFRTKLTETELAQVDRGLYGFNLRYESPDSEKTGKRNTLVDVFAATPGTIAAREEFRGSGGSHYWLQHRDISLGSERVRVEIRDRNSKLVMNTKMLRAGEDYTMNALQGHVILKYPLPAYADESELVRSFMLSGHEVHLVVRYEYTPTFADPKSLALGGRASQWIGDAVQVGVTASKQNQPGGDQELYGVDATVNVGSRSHIKAEVAQTTGPGTEETNSIDGGYQFLNRPQIRTGNVTARAYRLETSLGVYENEGGTGTLTAYTKRRAAGFSAPGEAVLRNVEQWGAKLEAPVMQGLAFAGRYDKSHESGWLTLENASVDSKIRLAEPWELALGVRHDERLDRSSGVATSQFAVDMGIRNDVAAKISYLAGDKWDAYAFTQATVNKTSGRLRNDRLGAGGHVRLSNRLRSGAELSGGTGGLGARVDSEYKYDDQHDVYASYLMDNSALDSGFRPRTGGAGALVSGVRGRYSDSTSVHFEERYLHGNQPTGLTHSFGVDLAPVKRWTFGVSAEKGNLTSTDLTQQINRTAGSVSVGYNTADTKGAAALEVRDETSSGNSRTTWLTRNQIAHKLSADWRWLAKLNLARSHSTRGDFFDGDWSEAQLGFGYRPVDNDRINSLFKYGYFELLPSPGQLDVNGATPEFRQRSHQISLDWIYDINENFSLGGKTALALRELRNDRTASNWYRSDAFLGILRLDYHVVYGWDALAEYRSLSVFQAEDRRSGFLLGVYRYLSHENSIKIGVGYNFTDFSDNLTDVSFNSHGWFVNLVGGF